MNEPTDWTETHGEEAVAVSRMLRTSPRKLNLVARTIRNMPAERALAELLFSKRRIAREVRKTLSSAVANAENNHNLDVDSLMVVEAFVGKNLTLRRGRPRARGRFGSLRKPFSQLTIRVREVTYHALDDHDGAGADGDGRDVREDQA
ncbi:MAG: 50S ribosomal protein L22 [Paracoccaceae bacterium]|nr:50S ribosomal protein L22 [Paracoccaceae bacterium]MDE2913738.1 50S ribosomal protein L22 [Paracoccaceae bacterium]